MILLLHKQAKTVFQVSRNGQELSYQNKDLCHVLWQLAREYPDEKLIWVEKDLEERANLGSAAERIRHELEMISYGIHSEFLPDQIGYIDQLPFININRKVKYPTWRMSSDIGGITGKTLLCFEKKFRGIGDFDYLLNSIAKTGQQSGLFCYSDPGLMKGQLDRVPVARASTWQIFSFVYANYKTVWTLVLFYCFVKYEVKFPLVAFLRSFFNRKHFGNYLDLPSINASWKEEGPPGSVDVIIPTIGRTKYLEQVIADLGQQTLVPKRVVVIEQNSDSSATSDLDKILNTDWPFQLIHRFTHKTGACMARNMAIEEVRSDWVFLADDDIRIPQDLLHKSIKEANRLGVDSLNMSCLQKGEKKIFSSIKQWGSFGSGTSIIKTRFVKENRFSLVFEHGYGEDADYGMKLRNSGCDIIYHPDLEILHLKAPFGGFRKKPTLEWEKEKPISKPSPTMMILAKRYFSSQQLKGFKVSLFLKFYRSSEKKNPLKFIREMNQRWKRSEFWAEKLEKEQEEITTLSRA